MLLAWSAAIIAIVWLARVLLVSSSNAKGGGKPLPGPPGMSSALYSVLSFQEPSLTDHDAQGKPLVGNLFEIPQYHSWLKFKEWADTYGPIFRLNLAGRQHVVLSTEKIANDLLRERGSYYSSREFLPMASGIVSREMRPLLLPYNDRWRRGRKLMHQLTMPAAADSYQPVQDYESKKLLVSLLETPASYEKWFELYASGVVFRIGFGKWIETGDEPAVKRIVQVNRNLERVASPGAYLVDSLPFLNSLPEAVAPFKREGRRLHEEELSLFRELQSDVSRGLEKGSDAQSFTRTLLENKDGYKLSDDEGAYVIGTLFEAGSGTTAAAMMSYCLSMCHFPEWQKKMQDELDEQVGDRMPEFEDLPNLPTVRAVIKEVLRWRPVTAGGFPHQLTKDDEYEGFTFKKGTIFHPNQWAIHRDPALYPDPDNFRPDRWLDPKFPTTYREPLSKFPNLQNYSCFGFGRRICPGQNIAERSLNILTARIAWASSIVRNRDADGVELPVPLYEYTKGFNTQPEHFDFDVVPRSQARHRAIRESLREARSKRPA
ncbi:cytochrome P450 monooxygenase [Fusarium bulbicola]|nr:cytochrome P450 monooxygenase [Fusarium bulbicola]